MKERFLRPYILLSAFCRVRREREGEIAIILTRQITVFILQ